MEKIKENKRIVGIATAIAVLLVVVAGVAWGVSKQAYIDELEDKLARTEYNARQVVIQSGENWCETRNMLLQLLANGRGVAVCKNFGEDVLKDYGDDVSNWDVKDKKIYDHAKRAMGVD